MNKIQSAYIDGNHYKIGFRGKVYVLRDPGDWCLCLEMDIKTVEHTIKQQQRNKRTDG